MSKTLLSPKSKLANLNALDAILPAHQFLFVSRHMILVLILLVLAPVFSVI
jgi:hypothetical protein